MMRAICALAAAFFISLFAGHHANAQTCTFSVSNIAFGTVAPIGAATADSAGTLSIQCSNLAILKLALPVTVTVCPNLDAGSGGSNSSGRLMTGPGGASLSYQLYQNSGRTTGWGAADFLAFGAAPTFNVTSDASGSINTTRPIYARLNAVSTQKPGNYISTFSGQNFFWGVNLLSCAGATVGNQSPPPTFTVTALLVNNCNLSTTGVDFGSHGLLASALSAVGQITVACTAGAPYSVELGNGQTGAGPTSRRMTNGAQSVIYGLYKDAAHTLPWGTGSSLLLAGTGVGSAQSLTVYGYLPAQSTPSPGSYSDAVVVTLNY